MWSTGKEWKSFLKIPILFDFQLKIYYICTIMWEEFTSVVLNRCVIWNWNVTNCRHWSATPKPLQLIQSHICISVLVFCELRYFFGDLVTTRMSYYFRQHCCISGFHFSDKLGLKFTVSQQFTSNFFRLQVLHCIVNCIYMIVLQPSERRLVTTCLRMRRKRNWVTWRRSMSLKVPRTRYR